MSELHSSPSLILPNILTLSGEYDKDVPVLYEQFKKDFAQQAPIEFKGGIVEVDHTIPRGKTYPSTFEHLITKGDGNREYDIERAERLCWCHAVITAPSDTPLIVDFVYKGDNRTYLWVPAYDYVVVLQPLGTSGNYAICTAHRIAHKRKRDDLMYKYKKSV